MGEQKGKRAIKVDDRSLLRSVGKWFAGGTPFLPVDPDGDARMRTFVLLPVKPVVMNRQLQMHLTTFFARQRQGDGREFLLRRRPFFFEPLTRFRQVAVA